MKKFTLLFLSALLMACSEDDISLSDSFFKIYDHSDYDLSFDPIDVVETVDGFIVLTGIELESSDFQGVQLMKMDENGEYEDEVTFTDYVIPVGDLFMMDSISYFFAANPTTLSAVLIGVNPALEVEVETTIAGLNYPLATSQTSGGNFLLLSYDPVNLMTQISEIGTDGSFIGGANYDIGPGDDVEEEIIDHHTGSGNRELPFFCGEVSTGNYYFNGFYNYSLSLVFTNLSDAPTGVVQGQQSDAGITNALALGGSNFAVAGYQFSDNYQLANTSLTTSGISSSVDLYSGDMSEIRAYSPSKVIHYSTGSTDYIVFGSETEGRQILLNFYDEASGQLEGVNYLGYLNPFTFSALKQTQDNSLLVLGTTYVAGRFERIALIKLSSKEIF